MAETSPAEAIFFAALERASGDRAAFLNQACGGDADLRVRIEKMLAAQPHLGKFLDLPQAAPAPEQPPTVPPVPPAETPGAVIAGKYKLLQRIAEGGMGSVWMADQLQPVRRRVAVKLIHGDRGSSQTILARFEAERQAIALMDHPHIAKLLDAGTTGEVEGGGCRVEGKDDRSGPATHHPPPSTRCGRPYFVMELIKGIPLNEFCDQHRSSITDRLTLFVQVCSAVQHAHQKGIIHRDLKPSNVLVEAHDDRPVPKVIDFGLAKALSGQPLTEHTLFTAFGTVAGTPLYMAPEQARFNAIDVDTRADIYSLGVILYELLTGTTPIEREKLKTAAFDEVLRLIRESEPQTPSRRLSSTASKPGVAANRQTEPVKLGHFLRGDLDWIVMKALAKERDRRYETANGLARDIERFLSNEPVVARPPSSAYRLRKFVRRNRAQVVAGGLLLLTLVTGLAGTTWGLFNADRARRAEAEQRQVADGEKRKAEHAAERARAEQIRAAAGQKAEAEQRKRADHEALVTRQNLYYAQMPLALQAWREHRGGTQMRKLLDNWLPTRGSADRRGWEWFYLNSLPYQNLRTLRENGGGERDCIVAWNGATKRLAEGTAGGLIRIWDVDREQTTLVLRGPLPAETWWGLCWLAWSPDGGRLAAGGRDGTVHVWDTGSGREVRVLRDQKSPVRFVAFSSDGRRMAAWGTDGTIKVWDADTGRLTATVTHPGNVSAGAWSPDDKLFASGHADGTVTISGVRAGSRIVTLRAHLDLIYHLAWSPDGTRLASTSSNDFFVSVWDVASRKKVLGPLRHSHGISSIAWQPDGQRLATGSMDQTVKIWDATTGHEEVILRGHRASITSLAWLPGGRLASGSDSGSLLVWNSIRDQESSVLPGHPGRATSVAWSPDGKRLASGGDDGNVRIWDPAIREQVLILKAHDRTRLIPQFGLMRSLAWSPDGTRLASAGLDGTAKVWDVADGREVFALPADHGSVWSVVWSPDGTRLAAGAQDGTIRVVEALARTPRVRVFKAHEPRDMGSGGVHGVRCLAWSPRGDRLASGGVDGLVKLWDPVRGMEVARMPERQSWVLGLSWSPDGTRLASGGADFLMRIWDVEARPKLATIRGHNDFVDAVAWSADGTRLASAGIDNSVRVWDPGTGAETFSLRGGSGMFHDVAWSPDGAQLAAASSDGQVWVWDATRGFERDTTDRAWPFIERKVAAGAARGEDRLAFAQSAYDRKRFAFATRLWADALASEPLGHDRPSRQRYHAACAAALAAAGQGRDEPPPDDAARAKLRREALDWLRTELALWTRQLESGQPAGRATMQQMLKHWQQDPDLAGIRDTAALATLPANERTAFTTLWADVAALSNKAGAESK